MVEIFCGWSFEAGDLATLRIHTDMTCRIAPSLPAASMAWKMISKA